MMLLSSARAVTGWRQLIIWRKTAGVTNVAVLQKGWLGSGNSGRNTTIIRSNYLQEASSAIFEKSRGLLMLGQTHHEARGLRRTLHANQLQGVETSWQEPAALKRLVPIININRLRYPILGAQYQKRGGTARHDAVNWAYARACSDMAIDIIQNCEVTGIRSKAGQVAGGDPPRARYLAKTGAGCSWTFVSFGRNGALRLPIGSLALQALVSEPVKPCLNVVVMANTVHGYISQSDQRELVIGGGTDGFDNYPQRGSFHHIEETLRQWAGIVDMTGDRSPFISKIPLGGCFLNCGWGTGGFKGHSRFRLGYGRTYGQGRAGPFGAFVRVVLEMKLSLLAMRPS